MTKPTTFLDGLAAAEREALLAAGRPRHWQAGERMIRVDDPANTVIVLLGGVAKVHTSSRDGDEVILGLTGPGDLLGEIAAVGVARRSVDVTALGPVDGVVVAVEELRAFLTVHPQVTLALLDLALSRLRLADRRRLEAATAESLPRVAARLVELVDRFGVPHPDPDGTRLSVDVDLPITQEELASWSGCSRESTARALRTLRELNVIETGRRHLTVHDPAALRPTLACGERSARCRGVSDDVERGGRRT